MTLENMISGELVTYTPPSCESERALWELLLHPEEPYSVTNFAIGLGHSYFMIMPYDMAIVKNGKNWNN